MRAVIGHINGKSLVVRFLVPGQEVAANNLISESTFAFEAKLYSRGFFGVQTFEDELMQEIIVVRGQLEFFCGLAVEQDLQPAADIRRTLLCRQKQRSQRHDGGLSGAPGAP